MWYYGNCFLWIHFDWCAGSLRQWCYWLGVMTSFRSFNITPVHPRDPTGRIPIPAVNPGANIRQTHYNGHIKNFHWWFLKQQATNQKCLTQFPPQPRCDKNKTILMFVFSLLGSSRGKRHTLNEHYCGIMVIVKSLVKGNLVSD